MPTILKAHDILDHLKNLNQETFTSEYIQKQFRITKFVSAAHLATLSRWGNIVPAASEPNDTTSRWRLATANLKKVGVAKVKGPDHEKILRLAVAQVGLHRAEQIIEELRVRLTA